MTTVAAVASGGSVYMAADTCTNVYDRPIASARKLRTLAAGGERILLGLCGDGALADLAETELHLEDPPHDGAAHLFAVHVARRLTTLSVDFGLVQDGRMDGSAVLGWRGRLWTLVHQQAIPHPDGIAAVGSGEGPAIGALDALLANGVDPAAAVLRAVEIGCARDRYSEPPIQVETLTA